MFESIEAVLQALLDQRYVADRALATVVFLATRLGKPLFLEGEAGVGKTEVAKVLASCLHTRLIRLQCYEGLDVHSAVYEWAYARQILHLRVLEATGSSRQEMESELYSSEFLLARPLLQAIQHNEGQVPVLLIDELDRSDEEFESYLLELLSEFQITIPELGTIRAAEPPLVILTSNRTREVHDALKRRCLYQWLDYPALATELAIVRERVPGVPLRLAQQVTAFVQRLRTMELYKTPGVSETIDWAAALVALERDTLDGEAIDQTLGVLLKAREDIDAIRGERAVALLQAAR